MAAAQVTNGIPKKRKQAASPARSRSDGKRLRVDEAAEKGEKRERVKAKDIPHFDWVRGMLLGPERQYFVRKLLGDGTFGRVLSCVDTKNKESVAVKVVKGVKRYRDHAEAEAEVLREILRCDPARQSHCVQLRDTFLHPKHHFCLVFERLDVSIRDFLKENGDRGMLVDNVRSIARQLLQCLSFLHAINLAHTDLKCRNVMFRDSRYDVVPLPRCKGMETRKPRNCEIVVIDFGGALFKTERRDNLIGTRHFRSPEVVLQLPWDEKTDVWSAGVLIAMTYIGVRPFLEVTEDLEHLALMERFLGQKVPKALCKEAIARGQLPEGLIDPKSLRPDWPGSTDEETVELVREAKPLKELIQPQHKYVMDLLEGMLQIDPKRRLSSEQASELPFIFSENEVPE